MTDSTNLVRLIQEIQPDEIYNLAAMSHVRVSFDVPEYVADADGIGTLRLLEAIRILGLEKKTRVYQAFYFRTVWQSTRGAPNRENAFLSAFTLCGCKNVCLLDYSKLP